MMLMYHKTTATSGIVHPIEHYIWKYYDAWSRLIRLINPVRKSIDRLWEMLKYRDKVALIETNI